MNSSCLVRMLLMLLLVGSVLSCNFPPSLWCSSPEIAQQCKVEYQCELHASSTESPGPVNFTLYYEALCPFCRQITTQQLWPVYKMWGENIINITLVPFGNAKEQWSSDHWEFQCQHGPDECTGNLIQTCAIHLLKNISTYFPFIHCMEASPLKPEQSGPKCAKEQGLDYAPIERCASGSQGNQLEHQMALKTDALNPPHKFVPWVTLNGVHNDEIQQQAQTNLTKLICDTYKGPKPTGCPTTAPKGCLREKAGQYNVVLLP